MMGNMNSYGNGGSPLSGLNMKTSVKVILIILGIIIIAASSYSAGKNSVKNSYSNNNGMSFQAGNMRGYVSMDRRSNTPGISEQDTTAAKSSKDGEDTGVWDSVKNWFTGIKNTVMGWFGKSSDATTSNASDNDSEKNESGSDSDKKKNNDSKNQDKNNQRNDNKNNRNNWNYWGGCGQGW